MRKMADAAMVSPQPAHRCAATPAATAHFCALVSFSLPVDAEKGQKALEIPHQNRNAAVWAARMAQAGTLIAVAHMQAAALVLGFFSSAPQ